MPLTEHRKKHHQTMDGRPNITPKWTTTDTHWMIVLQLQKGECRIAETQTVDKQHYISVAIFSLFTNNYLAYTLKVCNITVTLRLE